MRHEGKQMSNNTRHTNTELSTCSSASHIAAGLKWLLRIYSDWGNNFGLNRRRCAGRNLGLSLRRCILELNIRSNCWLRNCCRIRRLILRTQIQAKFSDPLLPWLDMLFPRTSRSIFLDMGINAYATVSGQLLSPWSVSGRCGTQCHKSPN